MADINIVLLLSIFVLNIVLLFQNLCQFGRPDDRNDDILLDSAVDGGMAIGLHNSHIAMSTTVLYKYQISIGLLGFDDKL